MLSLQMLVSNIFSQITDTDLKVKSKIIRNEALDYMLINRKEFEGWFWQEGESLDDYYIHIRWEVQQGDDLILKSVVM